jgi:CheY-like chemotaxis protein
VSCEESPAGRVRLIVSDTGAGIPPEMLGRLFMPFDRLGAEQTGIDGTGLGLALSKRLVEAMGGVIHVHSAADGTAFTVELEASAGLAGAPVPAEAAIDHDSSRAQGTVLYIEDNVANLRLLERIIRRRPAITLLSAMQGSHGLELAQAHRPQVIILDLHLPDLSGEDVLARLRDDARTRGIPVVILSADATPGQVTRLLAQGARAYLTKPLDLNELLSLLDEILSERAS